MAELYVNYDDETTDNHFGLSKTIPSDFIWDYLNAMVDILRLIGFHDALIEKWIGSTYFTEHGGTGEAELKIDGTAQHDVMDKNFGNNKQSNKPNYCLECVSYPDDFTKWDGVHIDDGVVDTYVKEVVETLKEHYGEGDSNNRCSIRCGDVTVSGYVEDGDYHVDVYRNHEYFTKYRDDE